MKSKDYITEAPKKLAPGDKTPTDPRTPRSKEIKDLIAVDPKRAAKIKSVEQKIQKLQAQLTKYKEIIVSKSDQVRDLKTQRIDLGMPDSKIMALKYYDMLQHSCSQYIQAVRKTGKLLYRGSRYLHPIYLGKPWDNRKTMSTENETQEKFDKILLRHGFKATRSNSIFTISDRHKASRYGDGSVFLIVPKNRFEITWSSKHTEFYGTILTKWVLLSTCSDQFLEQLKTLNTLSGELLNDYDKRKRSIAIKSASKWNYDRLGNDPEDRSIEDVEEIVQDITSAFFTKIRELYGYTTGGGNIYYENDIPTPERFLDVRNWLSTYLKELNGYGFNEEWMTSNSVLTIMSMLDTSPIWAKREVVNNTRIEKEMIDDMGLQHGNMEAALESENEVCLSTEYYAFLHNRSYRDEDPVKDNVGFFLADLIINGAKQ